MRIKEQLANNIADAFMAEMNPDRWDGRSETPPETVNTKTWEDTNIIKVGDHDAHVEIVIITDRNITYNHKPCLHVDLVINTESVKSAQTSTLTSTAIVAKMIQYVCNEYSPDSNKT